MVGGEREKSQVDLKVKVGCALRVNAFIVVKINFFSLSLSYFRNDTKTLTRFNYDSAMKNSPPPSRIHHPCTPYVVFISTDSGQTRLTDLLRGVGHFAEQWSVRENPPNRREPRVTQAGSSTVGLRRAKRSSETRKLSPDSAGSKIFLSKSFLFLLVKRKVMCV